MDAKNKISISLINDIKEAVIKIENYDKKMVFIDLNYKFYYNNEFKNENEAIVFLKKYLKEYLKKYTNEIYNIKSAITCCHEVSSKYYGLYLIIWRKSH